MSDRTTAACAGLLRDDAGPAPDDTTMAVTAGAGRPVRVRSTVAPATDAARERLARGQAALLSALVEGGPVPAGFDPVRIRATGRALAAKRAAVVARVAPELPVILGAGYRPAFTAYAMANPLCGGGYRRDALAFAEHLLSLPRDAGGPERAVRRRLAEWWAERAGPEPLPTGRLRRALVRLKHRTALGVRRPGTVLRPPAALRPGASTV
ncbi:hypothetical protein SCATT_46840 [Streptantibioticus cattleyicolor NRRL 8057 = DSM 46488]|uniref:SCO6045-like C-terminal domain-containing protein n=1 Tax=Streptantibioticus cattleyicolor (strain ATCC 35852 / DSM 46488 / JCM 4925 / NBRC 14057 / NRRL 8057) TaxID=1003195 RepID=F8JWQ7_STREN|nr:hypothetical protein SCATT_46840 [Streptantibioticus cattleyicolor NRRL 8057 = DSM 46488]MYS61520.1 hypothetical protein [Streptomyces sp. SID5468]CCB77380.1 protein of unknown function [Streptantibioticus cattleyicolor NRRL 8057 = DSM 46488]